MEQLDRVQKRRMELSAKIVRGKLNFLALILLTIVNCLLNALHTKITLPFYLMIPDLAFNQAMSAMSDLTRFGITMGMSALFLAFMIAALVYCLKSTKEYRYMLICEIMTAADFAVIAFLVIWYFVWGTELTVVVYMFLNFLFHIWVLVYVRSARKAGYALTVLPEKESDDEDEDPFAGFGSDEQKDENKES